MNARKFFATHRGGAPDIAEPTTQPTTTPAPAPAEPSPGQPQTPDPWRRREMEPGEEPHPKAAYGMDTTYSESARKVVANMLED